MSKNTIRKCDVCNKTEGRELKSADFVSEPLKMSMTGLNGELLTISCNITIESKSDDNFIDSVIDNYKPITNFDDSVYIENYGIQTEIAETQLEAIKQDIVNIDSNSDLCKICFKNLLTMLHKYAKFNKIEHF